MRVSCGCRGWVAGLLLGLSSLAVRAEPVQAVVLKALQTDPSLAEAGANLAAAESRTESAQRQHWPRLGVEATQSVTDRQQDVFGSSQTRPYATLNVWSGGGIEAQVRGNQDGERFFRSKLAESREDVAYRAAALYLDGLRAEEELTLARTNLLRHTSLMRDLGVVARLDTGRRSDLTQAQSRQSQARARVVTAETTLGVIQSRLLRYSGGQPVRFEPVSISAPALSATLRQQALEQPEYVAQLAEVERQKALVDVAKSKRWPQLDLETSYFDDAAQTRLLLNWELANPSTFSEVDAVRQQLAAAQARLATIEFDLREKLDTARVSYEQAGRKQDVTEEQIGSAQQVVVSFEEQFQIARRSMLDLLNAYSELSSVESNAASARAERRALALQYLRASGLTERWARQTLRDDPAAVPNP